jgi:glycine cleavage system transcriptional repressor
MSMAASTDNYLVVTVIASTIEAIEVQLTKLISSCNCNILNTRMTSMGTEMSITALISGNWGAIARVEVGLVSLEKKYHARIHAKRTILPDLSEKLMSYGVHAVTIDRQGILSGLTNFFMQQNILIEDIKAETFLKSNGIRILSLSLQLHIDINISNLRNNFLTYCDKMNLDAGIEPLREIY